MLKCESLKAKLDWNKYPSMPETPLLPEWHDTPEREAYWKEYLKIAWPENSFNIFLIVFIVSYIPGMCFLFFCGHVSKNIYDILIECLMIAVLFLNPSLIFWFLTCKLLVFYQTLKLYRKYGFFMFKLKSPDVSSEVGKILVQRPLFDLTEFRRYWPDEEHTAVALNLLKLTEQYRCFYGKMLYPNDVMLLFLYGKIHRWGKEKILDPPGEWFEDIDDEYDNQVDDLYNWDFDTTFAELVEMCITSRQKAKNSTVSC